MMFIIFCIVEEVDRSVDLHLTAVGSLRKFSCEEVGEGGHLGGRVAGRRGGGSDRDEQYKKSSGRQGTLMAELGPHVLL